MVGVLYCSNQNIPTKQVGFFYQITIMKMSEHEDSLLFRQRHTLAHVLAEAVQRVQQRDVEVAIGPAIDN
ncbi:hypothetical protein J5751_06590 [bacterium]|nr:hypothetical protein [bacterium]